MPRLNEQPTDLRAAYKVAGDNGKLKELADILVRVQPDRALAVLLAYYKLDRSTFAPIILRFLSGEIGEEALLEQLLRTASANGIQISEPQLQTIERSRTDSPVRIDQDGIYILTAGEHAFTYNPTSRHLACQESSIRLTPSESTIFVLLLSRFGELVTSAEINDALENNGGDNDQALWTMISRLKKKLDPFLTELATKYPDGTLLPVIDTIKAGKNHQGGYLLELRPADTQS